MDLEKTNSVEHLEFFLEKISKKEPFSVIRPNDGEYMIIKDEHFTNIDNWTFNGGFLREDLLKNIHLAASLDNSYIGIPCSACWTKEKTDWCIQTYNLNSKNLTYGNLVCNKNWKIFINYLCSNKIPINYIGPGTINSTELNIINMYNIDLYLVNKWNYERDTFIDKLETWIKSINLEDNSIFCFAAGPISKIAIPILFQKYPQYTFIDVGSAFDIFTKGITNRGYITDSGPYANIICDFETGHEIKKKEIIADKGDITCILNVYKRPHTLLEQINAIRNQTYPAKKIIIWRNSVDGYEIPVEIKDDKSLTIINSSENFGVWARFAAALLANTEYVCVFDDDTIPGKKWFENCIDTMPKVNGLLGTVGVIFDSSLDYYYCNKRHGWCDSNSNIEKVDIVGHSWFFKREWLQHLWKTVPDYSQFLCAGEDIAFAYELQKVGIGCYVPPHPSDDPEMFGSNPTLAWKYGTENVAISLDPTNKMNYVYNYFKKKGFKFIL